MNEQRGEQCALTLAAELEHAAVGVDFERTEDPELEHVAILVAPVTAREQGATGA
jgi:hypothetical protein